SDGRLAVLGPRIRARPDTYGYWLYQLDPAPRREVADVRDWMLAEAAACDVAIRAHDAARD
ncbi:LysR family transcriptional regulator, partial [Burkholderia multivorans]